MYNIDAIPPLVLGQLIEKGVNTLLFDVSGWLEEYPTGTFSISVIRPTETNVSPVASTDISVVDDILMWVIADTMTVYAGSGSVVIQLAVGDNVVKRSKRTQIIVNEGHAAPGQHLLLLMIGF